MSKPLILFGLHYIGHYTHVGGATSDSDPEGNAAGGKCCSQSVFCLEDFEGGSKIAL